MVQQLLQNDTTRLLFSIVYYGIELELICTLICKITTTFLKQKTAEDLKKMGEVDVAYVLTTYDKSDSWLYAFIPIRNIKDCTKTISIIFSQELYSQLLEKTIKAIKPNIRKLKKK